MLVDKIAGFSGLVALLAWQPAEAACHHYSIWKNPWPQPRCGVAARGTDPNDRSWSVEITKLPPSWTLDPEPAAGDRDQGVERLKALLSR
jgi:hypothetical protein